MNRMVTRLIVVTPAALAAFGGATPAQADDGHYIYVYGGNEERGRAKFFDGSTLLRVCDWNLDGNRVRAHLRSYTGTIYYSGWAPSQGCHDEGHSSSIVAYRVCAENYGCSAWHNRY